MSEGTYWAILTAPILECARISDGAKLFYAQISRYTNSRGYCWASNRALSEELGIGERTVSRYVAELEEAGFIQTELVGVSDRKRRRERRIRLAVPHPFELAKNGDFKLAKNGDFNLAKNGEAIYVDNNNQDNTPLEPPHGGPRQPLPAKWKPERFEAFWLYYRQNVNPANRAAARKAWDKLKPDDDTIRDIGRAIQSRLKNDEEWSRGIGRPHASTYLNGQMWLDELPPAQSERGRRWVGTKIIDGQEVDVFE